MEMVQMRVGLLRGAMYMMKSRGPRFLRELLILLFLRLARELTYLARRVCSAQVVQSPLDLIFLMDASSAIGSYYFIRMRLLASQLVDYFDVDGGVVRIAAGSYSYTVRSYFNLRSYRTAASVSSAIRTRSYLGSYADTAAALAFVRTRMLTASAGDRSNVSNVIVIFTDGPSSKPFEARVSHQNSFLFILY